MLSFGRADPQQRLLVLSLGGLTVLLAVVGVTVALVLADRVKLQTENLAGTLMTNAIHGHLQQQTIGGERAYTAPPPSDTAWWQPFQRMLSQMLGAEGVDVLNSEGAVVLADRPGEVERRFVPAEVWRRVRAGQATQYVRPAGAGAPFRTFVVVVPVTFVPGNGGPRAEGAVSVELGVAPLLRAARDARNVALYTTAGVLVLLLVLVGFLTRRLTSRTYRDPLTDLPNRRYFVEAATAVLAHNERHQRPSALLYADINRFGSVNTSLGHRAGDAVLKSVARTLTRRTRAGDTLARIGGDDFALLLNEASAEQARLAAESIATTLETATALDDQRLRISLGIGIAVFPQHGRSVDELLRNADTAMRTAKRDQLPFAMYETDDPRVTSERLSLEADLRDALLNDQLDVVFQPIVTSSDSSVVAYEALARWNHPSGPVSPALFIPIAENTGLIRLLDRRTYHHAVQSLAAFQQDHPTVRIGVNLSASSLADPSLPAYLHDTAERHHVPPQRLTFEVTESAAIQDLGRADATLQTLRKLGFRIALDDFGTGYSSLASLRTLPVDIVKIDRQFITGIGKQASDETLIRAIISYAQTLGMRTVAEGVETTEQHTWLQQQGIDLIQGYLHGKPAPLPQPTQNP